MLKVSVNFESGVMCDKKSRVAAVDKYRLLNRLVYQDGTVADSYTYASTFEEVLSSAINYVLIAQQDEDRDWEYMEESLEVFSSKLCKWVNLDDALLS